MQALIWRDAQDMNIYHIGIGGTLGIIHAFAMHRDCFDDLFGADAEEWAKHKLTTEPVPITLTLTPGKE